jgi:4-amino-4-deoxy-L-arabinose transferase-like glycosyltransferase
VSDRRLLLLLLLLALALRLPVFARVFWNGDEATYAALANALLGGQTLYVGAVDHKPPLVALTYAAVLGAAGRAALPAVHALSILVVAATGGLVARSGRQLGLDSHACAASGAAFVLFSSFGPPQDTLAANAEIFMLLPSAAALAVTAAAAREPARARPGLWAAGGLLVSLAALYKYQGAAVLAPVLVLATHEAGTPVAARRVAAMLGAAAALPVAIVAWYSRAGRLDDLVFWAWTYPLRYAGALGAEEALARAGRSTLAWALPCTVLIAGAVAGLARTGPAAQAGARRRVLLSWLAASALAVAAGGRFFLHYYLQLLPPLALLAATALRGTAWAGRPRALRLAAALGVALPAVGSWAAAVLDARVRPETAAQAGVYRTVGAFLDVTAAPGDTLFVWGNSPEIYHFARRDMGTRFPFCNHLSGKIWGTAEDRPGAGNTQRRAVAEAWPMLLDDIERRRPDWIVDAAAAGLDRWQGLELERFPPLAAVVARDYVRLTSVEGVPVYRRRVRT